MSTSSDVFRMPGQFEYDGMRFGGTVKEDVLARIKDGFSLTAEDVISVGLPKTGNGSYIIGLSGISEGWIKA